MNINHNDLELHIGQHCNNCLQLKASAHYPLYNNLIVASHHAEDKFFLSSREPKTDLSGAIALPGRYVVIGDIRSIEEDVFRCCVLENRSDGWLQAPDNIYIMRLLIAGGKRILISSANLNSPITQTLEYIKAKVEGRVIQVS